MRRQRNFLELTLIVAAIALLAAWMLHRPPAPAQDSPADVASQSMSKDFKAGNYDRCLDTSIEELRRDPIDLAAIRYQGMALARLGKPDDALRILSHGIDLAKGPMDWFLYSNRLGRLLLERGRVNLQLGHAEQAVKDLEKGLELVRTSDFTPWEFHHLLGLAHYACGQGDQALQDLHTAKAYSSDPLVQKHLAILEKSDKTLPQAECEVWCPICHRSDFQCRLPLHHGSPTGEGNSSKN